METKRIFGQQMQNWKILFEWSQWQKKAKLILLNVRCTQNSAGATEGYNFLKFLQAGEEYLKTFESIMNILNRYVVSRFYTNQI